jgi:hypothetical protein
MVQAFDRREALTCVEEEDPKGVMVARLKVRPDSSLLFGQWDCAWCRPVQRTRHSPVRERKP